LQTVLGAWFFRRREEKLRLNGWVASQSLLGSAAICDAPYGPMVSSDAKTFSLEIIKENGEPA